LRADPFRMSLRGRVVIPKPWSAVDPLANGVHIRIPGTLDALVPGGQRINGVGWIVNPSGTKWMYRDPTGAQPRVRRIVLSDHSATRKAGVRWRVGAGGGASPLPEASAVSREYPLGDARECPKTMWNPPAGTRPRCDGNSNRLLCR